MYISKNFPALVACVALSACAGLAPDRPAQRAPAFDLVGRVAVSYDGRAFSSGVRWEHLEDRDEIWLLTPVGQAVAHIEADASGATLTGTDRQQLQAADVESLTRRGLGWELPVARDLADESAGNDFAAHPPRQPRDQQGRLVRLVQDGWRVVLMHQADGGKLPQRLELTREGHQIRLVIDNWRSNRDAP